MIIYRGYAILYYKDHIKIIEKTKNNKIWVYVYIKL